MCQSASCVHGRGTTGCVINPNVFIALLFIAVVTIPDLIIIFDAEHNTSQESFVMNS